jgi:hypothetical protein
MRGGAGRDRLAGVSRMIRLGKGFWGIKKGPEAPFILFVPLLLPNHNYIFFRETFLYDFWQMG